jgi:predicted PurR-regulated permease PerM
VEVGESVGRILEAQFLISLIETIIIVIALWILGVPSLVLIGVIMFFVGLVPVLGGVIGALPVAWVAFTAGGTPLLVKSMIACVAIRGIAGYTIEPKIFGKRFHVNTVFILVILLLGFRFAGIWGVLLGLPVAYAIIRPRSSQADSVLV